MNLFTRFPIRLTIPLFLLLVALLAEGFTMKYNQNLSDAEEEQGAKAFVTQDMTQLQDNISDRLRKGDLEGVQSAIANRGSNPNITVIVLVDDAGVITCSTSLKLVGVPVSQALPDMDAALLREARATLTGRVFLTNDHRLVTAYFPVILDAKEGEIRPHRVGILHLRYDLTANKAILRHGLERQALVMAGFYIGYGLLLGLFLHLILVGRVGRLVSMARQFADGNLSTRTGLQGEDELAQIGGAFDRMAEEIAKSNKELQDAALKYRIVADNTYDWEYWLSPEGEFIYISPSCKRITGYEADEFRADPGLLGRIVHPDDRSRLALHRHDVVQHMHPDELEYRIVRPDGTIRWVDHVCQPVFDEQGGFLGTRGNNRDITERKLAEEGLLRERALLRCIIDSASDLIFIKDRDSVYLGCNKASERFIGLPESEQIGKSDFDFFDQEMARFVRENDRQVVEEGKTLRTEEWVTYPDGHRALLDTLKVPFYGPDGEIHGLVGICRDITGRKQAEEALSHLAAIVEYSEDAIIGKSPEGIIVSWNRGAERLYGYREEEVKGCSVSILIPDDHAGELSYILDQVKQGKSIEHYETSRLRKDGSRIEVSVTISPVCAGGGKIVGASTIARDITKRKNTETELRNLYEALEQRVTERTADLNKQSVELSESQQALMNIVEDLNLKTAELEQANARLQELDRLKSMFIASMSHELRTPLNSVIGFSSILHDEWIGPINPEQKENLAIILRCGKHLLSLINDVIDVSKIEARKIEVLAQEFDLYELMLEGTAYLAKDIKEKGLELRIENIHLQMFTDRQRLLQCVLNLLSNAMKFTEQGSISVEAHLVQAPGTAPEGCAVEISVTDTGSGIREEDLPRMFQPFVRFLSPLQAAVPGTGLGLYLTRKLAADVLKGDILVKSEYGKGSRFTIRIPVRIP